VDAAPEAEWKDPLKGWTVPFSIFDVAAIALKKGSIMNRKSQLDPAITPRKPVDWNEIFAALDRAGIPEDFLSDRSDGLPQTRSDAANPADCGS
jgi:hypothetical protein